MGLRLMKNRKHQVLWLVNQCCPLQVSRGLCSQSAHTFRTHSYVPLKARQRANTSLLTLLTFGILDGACFLCDRFTCIFIAAYGPPE